ncbi:Lariat debranching enzyme [Gracilariopsis chorda]|uniref:Lariat debranching enzyme n=1 Tax=Gracilariopsis chorda TaxID=448386 RepID=A0A2V3J2I1_9FLOR|nr:Lariat debranching enzyme [Gracilariopsis chorda]|eukprot:PXF48207.1 Lariat debranching enzyme [Gracilariopsis chorda]
MRVAVVGCVHGEVDSLYAAIRELERRQSTKVDLVICPGDFQAVRNQSDLACMACPPKYRGMGSFWKYYNGSAFAHVPTIFVGGNHEASYHLQQLPLGGLVAPNMYFLGNAGVVNFGGLRIAGISGVYTEKDYEKPRFERPPYPKNEIKSVYHTRKEDVKRLLRLRRPVDIVVSHDWPRGIWRHGDLPRLLSAKPFLRSEIANNTLGNPGTAELLSTLQPSFWFAAHMHVKFAAIVEHLLGKRTKFLALDKIVPRRDFVQLLDIPVQPHQSSAFGTEPSIDSGGKRIDLDLEWLSVLHTEQIDPQRNTPVTTEEMERTSVAMQNDKLEMCVHMVSDFKQVASVYKPGDKPEPPPSELEFHPHTLGMMVPLGIKANPPTSAEEQDPMSDMDHSSRNAKELVDIGAE